MKRKTPGTIIFYQLYRSCTYGGSMLGKCNYYSGKQVTVSYYFIILEYSSRIMDRSINYFRTQIPACSPMVTQPRDMTQNDLLF